METRALPNDSGGGSCFSPVGREEEGAERGVEGCRQRVSEVSCFQSLVSMCCLEKLSGGDPHGSADSGS